MAQATAGHLSSPPPPPLRGALRGQAAPSGSARGGGEGDLQRPTRPPAGDGGREAGRGGGSCFRPARSVLPSFGGAPREGRRGAGRPRCGPFAEPPARPGHASQPPPATPHRDRGSRAPHLPRGGHAGEAKEGAAGAGSPGRPPGQSRPVTQEPEGRRVSREGRAGGGTFRGPWPRSRARPPRFPPRRPTAVRRRRRLRAREGSRQPGRTPPPRSVPLPPPPPAELPARPLALSLFFDEHHGGRCSAGSGAAPPPVCPPLGCPSPCGPSVPGAALGVPAGKGRRAHRAAFLGNSLASPRGVRRTASRARRGRCRPGSP